MIIKNKNDIFSYSIISMLVGIITSGTILYRFLPIAAHKNQIYTDIISEVSITNTNKSGELNIAWIALIAGIIAMFCCKEILERYLTIEKSLDSNVKNLSNTNRYSQYGIGMLIMPIFFLWIVKQEMNTYLMAIALIYFCSFFIFDKVKIEPHKILLLLFTIYFSLLSVKALLQMLSDRTIINDKSIFILLLIIFIILVAYCNRKDNYKFIDKLILIFQIPIPLILLTYLIDKYTFHGEHYEIPTTKKYVLLVVGSVILLMIVNIVQYSKRLKKLNSIRFSELILLPTVVIAFCLSYYISPQQIHSADLWHLGEQMLPWDQIINKGLVPYEQYSPASGLYSMIVGFFQNVILDGTTLSYMSAVALQNIFFAICVGLLCYYSVGAGLSLFIGIMVPIPYYSRPLIFLLVFLILTMPKLVKNRVRWSQVYFLSSLISGLYYPLNGVAIAMAALPFCIVQLYIILKQKDIKEELKNKKFHLINIFCIVLLGFSVKLLFNMAKHILNLSSQSTLADGITANGLAQVQAWFMPYITNESLRKQLYVVCIFLIPITIVLLYAYMLYIYIRKNNGLSMVEKLNSPGFLLLCSGAISLPINYTYTFIRIDSDRFLSRSAYTIVIFAGILLPVFLWNYGKALFNDIKRFILIGICIGIAIFIQGNAIGMEIYRIQDNYVVPDEYTYVDGNVIGIPKLGQGFMLPETVNRLKTIKKVMDKVVYNGETFLDMSFSQELYHIFDKKVPVPNPGTYVVASGKASLTNIEAMKKNAPPLIVWNTSWYGSAIRNYYMYREIMDKGYVLYSYEGEDFLIRPDRYEEVFGNYEESHKNMISTSDTGKFANIDLSGTPNAWGKSISTLIDIFDEIEEYDINKSTVDVNQMEIVKKDNKKLFKVADNADPFLVVELPEELNGKDADFIYLNLKNNKDNEDTREKKVEIYWETNELPADAKRKFSFDYGNGEFLIPVGASPTWSFNKISKIRIDIDGFSKGTEFEVEKLKLLKLNENWMNEK